MSGPRAELNGAGGEGDLSRNVKENKTDEEEKSVWCMIGLVTTLDNRLNSARDL